MDMITQDLQHLREDIDTLIDWGWSSEKPTIDTLLGEMNLTGPQYHNVDEFITEYYRLAEKYKKTDVALYKSIGEMQSGSKVRFPRLAYNSLVPAASLGLVTSSVGGAIVGFFAGLGIDSVSQKYWKSVASPAKAGWWALAGGVVGATIDYFADTNMPFFTYILPAVSGTFGCLVETDKVVYRETPKTLAALQKGIQAEGRTLGDELVRKYADIIANCEQSPPGL